MWWFIVCLYASGAALCLRGLQYSQRNTQDDDEAASVLFVIGVGVLIAATLCTVGRLFIW